MMDYRNLIVSLAQPQTGLTGQIVSDHSSPLIYPDSEPVKINSLTSVSLSNPPRFLIEKFSLLISPDPLLIPADSTAYFKWIWQLLSFNGRAVFILPSALPGYPHLFSPQLVRISLIAAGFKITQLKSFNLLGYIYYHLFYRRLHLPYFSWWPKIFMHIAYFPKLSMPFGSIIVVTAHK